MARPATIGLAGDLDADWRCELTPLPRWRQLIRRGHRVHPGVHPPAESSTPETLVHHDRTHRVAAIIEPAGRRQRLPTCWDRAACAACSATHAARSFNDPLLGRGGFWSVWMVVQNRAGRRRTDPGDEPPDRTLLTVTLHPL